MDYEDLPVDISRDTTYRLVRKVATGGMGSVYEALQLGCESFEKRCAIKVILPKYTDNDEFISMFIGEAKLVANLVHQNIVQIYQLEEYEQGYFMAMEFIDGVNLEQLMDRLIALGQDIPIEIATFITSRICRGLEYAHTKRDKDGTLLGIVHRDVSPKNIMITSEGEVKLTDWGIAKARIYMDQKEGEVLMGKVEYMSPEQASYESTDARSDIFSLGIVFYELLTGHNMFMCDDVFDTIDKVKACEVPDPRDFRRDIPQELVDILMRCLEFDRGKRYQTAGEASYALEYYMYHGGYGPTIVALAKYMASLFKDGRFYASDDRTSEMTDTVIDTSLLSRRGR